MKPKKCKVCGGQWFPRKNHNPLQCPKAGCRSTFWNKGKGSAK